MHGEVVHVAVNVVAVVPMYAVAVNDVAALPVVAGVKATMTCPVPGPAFAVPIVGALGTAAKAGAAPTTIAVAITAEAASRPPI
ncbi:MAG TPA: hypothetical protein VG899_10905 [Mycobacteriales bacterium]|nr:hypothetical protein [Mycobacteriales bacterium]